MKLVRYARLPCFIFGERRVYPLYVAGFYMSRFSIRPRIGNCGLASLQVPYQSTLISEVGYFPLDAATIKVHILRQSYARPRLLKNECGLEARVLLRNEETCILFSSSLTGMAYYYF